MNGICTCPIWGTLVTPSDVYRGSGLYVNSPRAGGEYILDGRLSFEISDMDDRSKARLTSWLIEQRNLGVKRPEIGENEINLIRHRPDLSILDRADELLKYIQRDIPYIGSDFIFNASSPPMDMLAFTESVENDELEFLRSYLLEQDWLKLTNNIVFDQNMKVTITVKGYAHLAEMEKAVTDSSQAFVAMWFDNSMEDAWTQGIKPAIENAGYNPVRIDNQEYIGKIDDEIIAEIRRSRFIVADFTQGSDGARGGVYYEAGFAHGLDIPVVFTCSQDSIDNVHFDTSHYNHIVWRNPEELKERLENRIAAVIGDGPLDNRNNDV